MGDIIETNFASLSGPGIDLQKTPILAKIIFSDEAHFVLGLYVNKQNFRIWGIENTPTLKSRRIQKRVTVWCGYRSRGIIGPFFFENEQGDRYRAMLNEFLFTKIENEVIGSIWFQHDGAMCHTADVTVDVLRSVFRDGIINRKVDVVWPPWNCDSTPLDSYLLGAIKGVKYRCTQSILFLKIGPIV